MSRAALTVALFHSMFGLRPVELAAAARLRTAGHRVVTPDLFAGAVAGDPGSAPTMSDGYALMGRIGWDTIVARARAAVHDLPADAVLGGFSMGVGVVGALWPDRLRAAGVFLIHAITPVPAGIRAGTPVQAHVGEHDPIAPPDQLAVFRSSAELARAASFLHVYTGADHFFTDPSLPDHNPAATARTWTRVEGLLENLRAGVPG